MTSYEVENCSCRSLDLLNVAIADAEVRHANPGDTVWDSTADHGKLVVVKSGSVRVYDQPASSARPRLAHVIGAGHWVGLESFAGVRGTTRVVAAQASTIAVIDASHVLDRVTANPDSARRLIKHLAEQSIQFSSEITEMLTQDCTSQVVNALLRLSRCGGTTPAGDGRVMLHITQQDVADAVGIARETVNAMIQKLAESGLIQKQRGRIIFDPKALRQASQAVSGVASNN